MLRNLYAEMVRVGVSREELADEIGVNYNTIGMKINGKSKFYLDEAIRIRDKFFPECKLEYLYKRFEEEERTVI
jgi:DNA-binding XRE family transcriptional regulator